jgi:2-amino-4-hydroxy-6-hydroxymethyldihydropteridine diphosphokinase
VTTLVATSSIYETAPVGGPDQGAYLNAVAVVETDLAPRRLLDVMLDVERRMGRVRRERWGPRTIDLDLLLHGDSAVDEPGLTVPHPRLTERRFALEPLLEVWPEATLPDGRPLADFLEAVADQDVVRVASSE